MVEPLLQERESVWDYPRPPALAQSGRLVRVELAGTVIAKSTRCWRVLETSHPPTWYIPKEDVQWDYLEPSDRESFCEWKGCARYFSVRVNDQHLANAAWSYEAPSSKFYPLTSAVAFYPSLLECYVDDERVEPQPGGFYGGWVTSDVEGPFKGSPGTAGW